jgi:hypothetical protein
MSAVLTTRNWPAKLIVWLLLVLALHGFLRRIADPLAAAMGGHIDASTAFIAEVVLLALYTLGLFAFPGQFWRRAFKFVCLMAAYMLLGPLIAAALPMGAGAWSIAAGVIVGHVFALALGFVVYKLAWPRLRPYEPAFNPAG